VPVQRLAFIACEDNARRLVLSLASRHVLATIAVGGDSDLLAFDPRLQRLYVAGEHGIVSAFALQRGSLHRIGQGRLGPDAHMVTLDPATHRVCFPLQDLHGKTVLHIMAASC
jgi:DNA-binding beta-propeller fold protein YncE